MILSIGLWIASTFVFGAVIGDFGWQNILIGGSITLVLMYIFRREITPTPPPPAGLSLHLLIYAPVLLYYLFVDILVGTWMVVTTTLGIRPLKHPGIVRIPIRTVSPYSVGPVGFFITLSPGSFLVDVDWENRVMLVHVLDASDPDAVRRDADKYYRLWEYGPSNSASQSSQRGDRFDEEDSDE